MPPIVLVFDHDGRIVHECAEEGCTVSWDGIELATGRPVPGRPAALPPHARDRGNGSADLRRPGEGR